MNLRLNHLRKPLIRLLFVMSIWYGIGLVAPKMAFAQQAGITFPADGGSVSGEVYVLGTAVHNSFERYELYFKQDPSGDDAYKYFDGGAQQVQNGTLGIWRTATLPPGIYTIRLRVVKQDSNYDEYQVHNISVNQGGNQSSNQAAPPATAVSQEIPTQESPTPTETPTPGEVTPTPIPSSTFTPGPTPTPNIGVVTQPALSESLALVPSPTPPNPVDANGQPSNTLPTPEPVSQPAGGADQPAQPAQSDQPLNLVAPRPTSVSVGVSQIFGNAFSIEELRTQFWRGVRYSAAICLAALALFSGKQVYAWSRRKFR